MTRYPRPPLLDRVQPGTTVLQASAGTGKTWALERIVLDLLLTRGLTLDQILVVTYTEKAASEMKSRIREMLRTMLSGDFEPAADGEPCWIIGPEEERRLEAALAGFDRAGISTIHGFCQRILQETAFLSGRSFETTLAAGDEIFARAFGICLRERWAADEALAGPLREALDGLKGEDGFRDFLGRAHKEGLCGELEPDPDSWPGRVVSAFLPAVRACVREIKEREALLDFDDMILDVRDALVDPQGGPALVARLRERYRAALVDEFQDANEEQWTLFRTAFQTPDLYLVLIGDPKQAIYSFRGGDVETYRKAVATACHTIDLDRNYRSTPAMIGAYNRILEADFFSGAIGYPVPVKAGREDLRFTDVRGAELAPITLVPVELEKGVKSGLVKWRLARAMAREIADLLASGARLGDEPLEPGDVFVLTRWNRDAVRMAEALREEGVPVALFKQEGLSQSPEAMDVLNLLKAVQDPSNRSARARAWLTPFFGLAMADLPAARDLAPDHPLRERLQEWHLLAADRRYPALFRGLAEDSGVTRRMLGAGCERSLGLVMQLLEHVLEQGETRRLPFDAVVAELDAFIRERRMPPGEDPDLHRLETDRSAVQILTMHKSKGLEAKVVAVLGQLSASGDRKAFKLYRRHEKGRRTTWIGADSPDLKALHEKEEQEEEERLLYVALTRAKARLILPVFRQGPNPADARGPFDRQGDPKGSYRILNRRLRALEGEAFFAPPSPGNPAPAQVPAALAPPALPPIPSFAKALLRARPQRVRSFTSISRELPDHGPDDPESRPPARATQGLPGGAATGSCLHQVLEETPLESLEETPDLRAWTARMGPLLNRALDRYGLARSWKDEVARMVFNALTTPLELPGGARIPALAKASPVLREMEFTFLSREGEDFTEGSIDFLFQWEGRTYFLDWKSNILPDYGPGACAAEVAAAYDLQARIYTLATVRFLGIANREDYRARFGGGVYLFLRGLGVHGFRPSWEDVLLWQAELSALLEELAHV